MSGAISDVATVFRQLCKSYGISSTPPQLKSYLTMFYKIIIILLAFWGTRWRSWLRHWAISRNIAGSIPDGVIEIFHWNNPSSLTMALGSNQPLTEMSTRNISWG